MKRVRLTSLNDFAEWRLAARALLIGGTHPEDVVWEDPAATVDLFAEPEDRPADIATRAVGVVPPRFIELAEAAICHRETIRFGLLYRLLFRLQKDRDLIEVRSDPDISKLYRLASEVRRDSHKMKAFVRFREDEERFAAWFEPDHYTLERTAPFFVRRFASMQWAIMTPYRSAAWDGEKLLFGEGTRKKDAPRSDAMEEVWRTYFASIFNPARLKVQMMKSEMPVKYWRNLPEAELIPSLIAGASARRDDMLEKHATTPPVRHTRRIAREEAEAAIETHDIVSLADARAQVQGCRRCPLYQYATQAVFGEGPESATIMFVGEQPGDQEDLSGKPFVGPAGRVLDAAMQKVGIPRKAVYVTNAVKHFKFTPRGKKRIHKRPDRGEIVACKFWLNLEREFIRPKVVVAMGATAATSLLDKSVTISGTRGEPIGLEDGSTLFVTIHPSYLLRLRTGGPGAEADIAAEQKRFETDLEQIWRFAQTHDRPARGAS
jgi:DNA polymerase